MATPAIKQGPIIVISLLVTTLCLSIGAIALILLFNNNRPTTESLTSACKDQVGGAIAKEYDRVVKACQESAQLATQAKTFAGIDGRPGFSYPATWSAVVTKPVAATTGPIKTLYVSPEAIDLNIAAINHVPITMEIFAKDAARTAEISKAGSLIDYVKSISPEGSTVTESGTNTVTATYTIDIGSPASGSYEDIYYFGGNTTLAKVEFLNFVPPGGDAAETERKDAEQKAAFTLVKNSLDFSTIQ